MKIKYIFGLFALALAMSSCGSRINNPEEMAVPIIHAIQDDNAGRLDCMLPSYDDVNAIYAANKGELGWVYYNKYTKDYREKHLHGRMRTCLDIIKTISADNNLNWDEVEYTNPKKEDVNDSLSGFSIVTTHLKFPNNKEYELKYTAANAKGKWYLMDDVWFSTIQADAAKK